MPHCSKNREGRTFPYDVVPALKAVIDEQVAARDRLRARGVICRHRQRRRLASRRASTGHCEHADGQRGG
jgi:hypothetical protein